MRKPDVRNDLDATQQPTMSRRPWIAAFIGHALRRGAETDPDSAFHVADSMFLESRQLDPELAADSAFGALRRHDAADGPADDPEASSRCR
ncbi:MAG: hypothetical protein ABI699_13365 [Caldimonas sp.]